MSLLMLYHHPLSVCSMKVRLALEEKGLAWSGRVIDILKDQEQLEPWYIKLNPRGVVPTLEFRGGSTKVITDSAQIIRFIATLPEGNDLLPCNQKDLPLMEKLIDLADEIDLQILSYARHPNMEKSEEILDSRVSKSRQMAERYPELKQQYQACSERSLNSKNFRVDAEHIVSIEKRAIESLAFAEQQLKGLSFLVGSSYTLADVIWTVVLSRLDLLGYTRWVNGEEFPLLASYYMRAQNRKSYLLAQIQNEWWVK